ncbi:MAG: hypothetical protein JW730_07895 [Anaerolineales bacterium]|nr:hypothetical protein [Anaerolineales bacterium]
MRTKVDVDSIGISTDSASATTAPVPTLSIKDDEVIAPALVLSIDPDILTPGGRFVLSWVIEGVAFDEGVSLSLQLTLPESFSLEGTYDGYFDPDNHILTIPVAAMTGQVLLKADHSTEPVTLMAVLSKGEEVLANASLSLAAHEQFLLDPKGGSVQAKDRKVKVQFPKGAFSERAVVEIGEPSGDEAPPYSLSGRPFEIKAHGQQSRKEFSKFSQEITIFASYAELGIPTEQEENLYLHWYNAETGEWVPLPTDVDKKTKTLEAVTDHFTVFDIDVNNWQASRLPTVDAFQVSNFTGAGSYSLPIVVPPGPGGLQPSLALNYNSQVIDQSTTLTQASWVGMGWSLDTGSIELDSHGTNGSSDDTYFLNVGGVSTRIVKDTDGSYHAADENFWKISRDGGWTVMDKQGNTYFFEHVARRVYSFEDNCHWQPYQWSLTKIQNIFGVEINYTYRNQIKQVKCEGHMHNSEAAVYPDTITYAGARYRVRFDSGSSQNRWDYQAYWDTDLLFHAYQKQRLQNIYVEQDLDGDGTFETILRRYEFQYANDSDADIIFPGYTWTKGGKTTTLQSVREYGVGGTTSLPATTFIYGDNLHLTRAQNGYGGAVEFVYELWYDVDHARSSQTIWQNFGAYGHEPCLSGSPTPWRARAGTVYCEDPKGDMKIYGLTGIAFAADIWNNSNSNYKNHSMDLVRPGGVYLIAASMGSAPSGYNYNLTLGLNDGAQDLWADQPGNSYIFVLPASASKVRPLIKETGAIGRGHYAHISKYTFKLLTSIYRVTEKRVMDGIHTDPYVFMYDYSNNGVDTGALNTPENSPNSTCEGCPAYTEWYSEFRGHGQVTEIGPDGRQTITKFYQDDLLKGRPIETRTASGSQTLVSTLYQYTTTPLSVSPPIRPECPGCQPYVGILRTWVTTDWAEKRIYANDGSYTATRQTSTYESDYGNLVTLADQVWDGSNWNTYRSTVTEYFPNTTGVYLVGLPARQQIRDANDNVLAESLNLYDSNSTYDTAPSVGKLRAVRAWVDGAHSTGRYSQATYDYDAWGNRTEVTASDEYGNALTAPAAGMRTAVTVFDPVFHAYPVSQTTPPAQSVPGGLTITWNYDYDNNGADDYILGLPTREMDPNGNITSAHYDTFGRMTRLIRPGDDSTYPTVAIDYHDTSFFWTEIRQRIDEARYLTIRRHYDGIGRQTYIENGHTNAGSFSLDSIISYQYPAFNIVQQSMPYAAGGTAFYATTESDVLGRPLTVTAPNGNVTSYSYDGLVSAVTDAKGYSTTATTDEWGRLLSVAPPAGPGVTYTYDEFNNLKTAARGGVTTEIYYDHAGRKTSMVDPDMGNWSYSYDALGSLTTQTDARGCQLNLSYDTLNRLLTKDSSGTGCGTQVNTVYTYDEGANGPGQRTSMNDDSGSASWAYDARGRMIQETKTINQAIPQIPFSFITSWAYNSADLPITMTYPDSEVLTYHYNDKAQLDSVSSSLGDTYLADAEYDEAGRVTRMDYGAGVIRKIFSYFPWDVPVQGGLLDSAVATRLSDSAILQSFAYAYDANANVETITDHLAGPQTQTFGYDSLNRLISAEAVGGTDGLYSETYSYDSSTGNLAQKGDLTYSYSDSAHAHAVTNAGTNTYTYDENGNMIQRIVEAQAFDLAYDAENRLIGAAQSADAVFSYDGDGKRVKSVINDTETTYFVGAHYEMEVSEAGTQVNKYYYAGTQRIAMRTNGALNFLLGDHLGSTSLTVDAMGNVVSEQRYKAWGEVRYASGDMPTNYTYTGQYSYASDFGLMYYNARWYDPSLGRFNQPDTMIPKGVQGLDRYAYVKNSPLGYVDPTGHFDEKKQLIKWFGKNWRDLFSEAMEDILLHADFGDMVIYAKVGEDTLLGAIFAKDENGNLVMWDLAQKAGVSVAYIDHMKQDDVVSLYKLVDDTNDRQYKKDHSIATMSEELPEGLYLPSDDYDVGDEQYLSSNTTYTYEADFLIVLGTGVGIASIFIEGTGPLGLISFGIGLLSGIKIDGRTYTVHQHSPYSVPTPGPIPVGTPAFGQ